MNDSRIRFNLIDYSTLRFLSKNIFKIGDNRQMNIGKILRKARLDAQLTMRNVEAKTGVIASRQSKIELGETSSPDFLAVARLAEFYNLSMEGIHEAIKSGEDTPLAMTKAIKCQHIPIIAWENIDEWNGQTVAVAEYKTIPSPFKCSKSAYALEVKGDSMTSTINAQNSFPEGSLIIIEPETEPKHRSFVIAQLKGTGEFTFKRLNTEGGHYLQPLNQQHPIIPIDESVEVCGVVRGVIQSVD